MHKIYEETTRNKCTKRKKNVSANDKKNNQKYKNNMKFYRVGKNIFPGG
jgi:hypothetical protein